MRPLVVRAVDAQRLVAERVTVPVRHAGSIVGGGEVPMTDEVHVWRFGSDGKVASFKHMFDYSRHERAAAKRSAALAGRTLRVLDGTIRVDVAGEQVRSSS